MNCEKLSPRQLWVAVLTGGLSAGAAAAGRADWRWLLLSAALGAAVGWFLLRRVGWSPLHPALRILYAGWAAVLMADVLSRTAGRIQQAAGKEGHMGWLLVLLALPLAWMGWGKAAAFFRAAEIFWLALLVTAGAVLLLGLPRMDWGWVMVPGADWKESLTAGGLTMSTGLFVLPHLYKVEAGQRQDSRGLVWLGALGAASAGLALLTAGLLHPHTAARLDVPFFTAAGLLGDSARLEGLISALWLLSDLTLAGLLARCWGEERWPALAALAALALALTGVLERLPRELLCLGCLGLALLTAALPPGQDK